tara:strand:- start:277 stop:1539 length:1263 start_codon:yes stop_codon:yes gene_type:complete
MSAGKIINMGEEINKSEKYFKGKPEITFFKKIFKKTSNFNIDLIEQDLQGNIRFGGLFNCIINKSGDLLKSIFLEITLPDLNKPLNSKWYGYTNNIGCSLIKTITLKINDQIIDKIYGEWIDIYYQMNNINIDNLVQQYNSEYSIRCTKNNIDLSKRKVYIPIPFFFSKDSGLALPLLALNNSIISIDIELRKLNEIIRVDNIELLNNVKIKDNEDIKCNLYAEVIYLDNNEKKMFINKNLEYLIEQVQFNNNDYLNKLDLYKNIDLDFRHLVKEFIWVITLDNNNLDNILEIDHNKRTQYTTKYSNYLDTFDSLNIKLNSITLIDKKADYFRKIQSNIYHKIQYKKYIYSYSTSLNPSLYQPSGYINLSNTDNITFNFKFKDYKLYENGSSTNGVIKIFGINYNVLKIVSGQGGLIYSV